MKEMQPGGAGYVLDKVGSSIPNAMQLQAIAAGLSLVFLVVGFMVPAGLALFIVFLGIGILLNFVVTSPLCRGPFLVFTYPEAICILRRLTAL